MVFKNIQKNVNSKSNLLFFRILTGVVLYFASFGFLLSAAGFPFSLGAGFQDYGKDIAVDSENNIYVVGYFQGAVDFDPSAEGRFELTAEGSPDNPGAVDIFVAKYSPDGGFLNAFKIGSPGADMPHTIRIDKIGNIYIAGYIGGRADFDASPESQYWLDAGTGRDAFIAKYDKDLKIIWAYRFGDIEEPPFEVNDMRFEDGFDMDVDANGNVALVGTFNGRINLNPTNDGKPEVFFDSKIGFDELPTRDIFVTVLTADGKFKMGFALGGRGQDHAHAVRFGSDGSLYIGGIFSQTCDFNPDESRQNNLSSTGLFDCFLAKYSSEGNYVWAFKWGSISNDQVRPGAMTIDKDDNIYVGGDFSGNTNFNPNGFFRLSSKGSTDAFIAKYSSTGEFYWAIGFGAERQDFVHRLALDNNGNIYAVGSYGGEADFDPDPDKEYILISKATQSAYDAFIAKYTVNAVFVNAAGYGVESISGDDWNIVAGLALDNTNHIYLTGRYYKYGLFYPDEFSLLSKGSSDAVVAKYKTSLELIRTNVSSVNDIQKEIAINIMPNPANNYALISFSGELPVGIAIFNSYSAEVAYIDKYALFERREILWECKDRQGNNLPSGAYFIRFYFRDSVETRLLNIIR